MKRLLLFLIAILLALASPAYAEGYSLRPLGAIPSPLMDAYPAYSDIAPLQSMAGFPEEYTWPDLLPKALDQGPYAECVAYSLRAVKDMLALSHGLPESHSAGFIYANRHGTEYMGEGMYPLSALANLKKEGVCRDILFPNRGTYPELWPLLTPSLHSDAANHKITNYARIRTNDEVKSCLINTSPVSIMIPVYPSFYNCTGTLSMPGAGETPTGNHEVTICGWKLIDGNPYWYVLNSWGPGWGENGYCYMPFGYPITEMWAVVDGENIITPASVNFSGISLTAEVEGLESPQYKFQYRDLRGAWITLQDSYHDTCALPDYLPPGSYTVVVTAKGAGREVSKIMYLNFNTIIN